MSDYWINRKKTIKNYLTALNRIDLYDDIVNKAVQADEQMRSLAKLLQSLGTIINQEQADIILSTYASQGYVSAKSLSIKMNLPF